MKTNSRNTQSFFQLAYKSFSAIVLIAATLFTQASYAQDGSMPGAELYHSYIDIKNALVAGDAPTASLKSEQYVKILHGMNSSLIPEGTMNALVKHAGLLSAARDIKHQREEFQPLSANMYLVAKSMKLSGEPIYYAYCPMKKAYWLSNEAAIKNPYFGSSMLTCGKVQETLK